MKLFKHCLLMWIPFVLILCLAIVALELIEGSKITTSEYYGIKDFGSFYVFFAWAISIVLYPVIGAPISIILYLSRIQVKPVVSVVICGLLGAIGGRYAFIKQYGYYSDMYFVKEFDLHMSTAIIIFLIAGCGYAAADYWVRKLMEHRLNRTYK